MAIPISLKGNGGAGYDIFDWYRHADLTPAGDAFTNDQVIPADSLAAAFGAPIFAVGTQQAYVTDPKYLQFVSPNASTVSQILYQTAVPTPYTCQVELYFELASWLPDTFLDGVVALGVFDAGNSGIRFFVSKEGIAFIPNADPGAAPVLLDGSADLIQFPCHLKLHLVYEEDEGVVQLYATSEDAAGATTEKVWAVSASAAGAGVANLVDFSCYNSTVVLETFRLSSEILVSDVRPTAVITGAEVGVVGRAIRLSGLNSTDPEGLPLTYAWRNITLPAGGEPMLGGMVESSTNVTGGMLSVAAFITTYLGTSGNSYEMVVLNAVGDPVFTLTYAAPTWTFTAVIPAATSMVQFVNMVNASTVYGQPAEISEVFTGAIITNNGLEAMPTGTYTFSGGVDSNAPTPSFAPQVPGTYVFGLTVNDGVFDSEEVQHTLEISADDSLLETVPDAEFIWDTLPDFWGRLAKSDRGVFTTVWSSLMQVASGQLLRAWQDDYAKSIRDIPTVYQRKWVGFNTLIPAPTYKLEGYVGYDRYVGEIQDDNDWDTTTSIFKLGTDPLTTDDLELGNAGLIHTRDDIYTDLATQVGTAGGINYIILSEEHAAYTVDASGTSGRVVSSTTFSTEYGVFPAAIAGKILQIGEVYYSINSIDPTDSTRLIIDSPAPIPFNADYYNATVCPKVFATALPTTGLFLNWSIITPVPVGATAEFYPYYTLTEAPPRQCYAKVSITLAATLHELYIPIRYGTSTRAFPDWSSFSRQLGALLDPGDVVNSSYSAGFIKYMGSIIDGSEDYWGICAYIHELNPALLGFQPHTYVPIDSDIVGIPVLKDTIVGDTTYYENVDYTLTTIQDQQYIYWTPTALTFTWAADGTVSGLPATNPGVLYYTANGASLELYDYDATALTAKTGLPPLSAGSTVGWYPKLTPPLLVPDIEWAELVKFNNDERISDNFGAVVGLPKVAQENYKSDITAMWFCLWNGPKLTNLEIAANAIVDRELFLRKGTVVGIETNYNATSGRIFIQETGTGLYFGYTYLKASGLAIHPDTGVSYAVGDAIEDYWPVNGGLTVDDYKSDPAWFARYLTGQDVIKKYFHFTLKIDAKAGVSAEEVALLVEQFRQLRPQYTDIIFVLVVLQQDNVDVVANHSFKVKLHMADNLPQAIYTTAFPPTAPTLGTIDDTANAFPARFPGLPLENLEVYESCYLAGHLDDYGGDGSWHIDAPGIFEYFSGTATAGTGTVGDIVTVEDAGEMWPDLTDYYVWFETLGPGMWGKITASGNDTFTFTKDDTWTGGNPVNGTTFKLYTPTDALVQVNQVDSDVDWSKTVQWVGMELATTTGFDLNEIVTGPVVGGVFQGEGRIVYVQNRLHPENHFTSFILVQRYPINTLTPLPMGIPELLEFNVGDLITGSNSGATATVTETRIYTEYIFEVDTNTQKPESRPGFCPAFYSTPAGILPSLDYGLALDDQEPHTTPTGSTTVPITNMVPSFDFGQYWWVDTPAVDDYAEITDGFINSTTQFQSAIGGNGFENYAGALPGDQLLIMGATTAANNGAFTITGVVPGAPGVLNFAAGTFAGADPNNGSLRWHIIGKYQPWTYWNIAAPNVDDGSITAANTFTSATGTGSYNGAAPGDYLYIESTAVPGNSGYWEILLVGANITTVLATMTFPDPNLRWCVLPSWWDTTWTPVHPDYVHRDDVVYRYLLAGDRMPNVTHGHTMREVHEWFADPVVVGMIVAEPE